MARSASKEVWLPQVPSPAQAAKAGWHMVRFVRVPPVDQITLCIAACSGSALNDDAIGVLARQVQC